MTKKIPLTELFQGGDARKAVEDEIIEGNVFYNPLLYINSMADHSCVGIGKLYFDGRRGVPFSHLEITYERYNESQERKAEEVIQEIATQKGLSLKSGSSTGNLTIYYKEFVRSEEGDK